MKCASVFFINTTFLSGGHAWILKWQLLPPSNMLKRQTLVLTRQDWLLVSSHRTEYCSITRLFHVSVWREIKLSEDRKSSVILLLSFFFSFCLSLFIYIYIYKLAHFVWGPPHGFLHSRLTHTSHTTSEKITVANPHFLLCLDVSKFQVHPRLHFLILMEMFLLKIRNQL